MTNGQPTMSLPSLGDWAAAVCSPDNYQDDQLKSASIERNSMGLPKARSGAFAVVFRGELPNGQARAIRVFTSAQAERQDRYKAIYDHLVQHPLSFLVPFTYAEKGIRCKGKRFPLVTMEWVHGDTLFDWLDRRTAAQDGRAIAAIAEKWRDVMAGLKRASIAHGDLQDRNVMINDKSEIKLVDYDGMCVPRLVGRKNEELGVPPYQHPQRNGNTRLTSSLDNFSSIFIYVGLRALSVTPRLWQEFVASPEYDKILFRAEDFENPGSSALFGRLAKSPDQEVKRLAKELSDLWRAPIDTVPPLDELLFSFDQVAVLLDQRDFDAAKELLVRNNKRLADAPSALQPRINEAMERVAKREELEKAVQGCNEPAMAALAGSPLLQGYPRACEALAVAADAPAVDQVIQQLEAAKASAKWRDFVRVWDQSRQLLTRPKGKLRGSVAGYDAAARSWGERNTLCDQLLTCLKTSDPDVVRVASLAKQLADRGGHPECDSHRSAIDLATARDTAWRRYDAVPKQDNEPSDVALMAAWQEEVFRGWPRAEKERSRLGEAGRRVQVAAAVRAVAGSASREGELDVIRLGSSLPAGWSTEIDKRCASARERIASLEAFTAAVTADSDIQICDTYNSLLMLQATELAANDNARVQAALKRGPAIVALKTIPPRYSNADAIRWDTKLLAAWDESLLGSCRDAAAWKSMVETALRRRKLLAALASLVAAQHKGDAFAGYDFAADPCLEGYSFDDTTSNWLAWSRTVVRVVQEMTVAAQRGDRTAFLKSFDAAFMRGHAPALRSHWHQLLEWVQADVLPAAALHPPIAQKPLEVTAGAAKGSSRCRLKWRWPEKRFADECMVVICRTKPAANAVPQAVAALVSFPMTRESYEDAGGFRTVHAGPDWKGAYIAVWAKIDLGRDSFWSQPLVLGRI